MTIRLSSFALSVAVLTAPLACQSGQSLPDAYLGRWYYVGTSGGIAGDSFGEPDGSSIVLTRANEIESYDGDGALIETIRFDPTLGPSIFSTADEWLIEATNALPRVIRVWEDGETMSLSENVYDGFSYAYRRSR